MALQQVFFDPNALKRFRAGPLASAERMVSVNG